MKKTLLLLAVAMVAASACDDDAALSVPDGGTPNLDAGSSGDARTVIEDASPTHGDAGDVGDAGDAAPPNMSSLRLHCQQAGCPSELCEIQCCSGGGGGAGCAACCEPKPCQNIPADKCPLDACQLMTNCLGQQVCFYKFSAPPPACGGETYYGQDVACCAGLKKVCGSPNANDDSCNMATGYNGLPQCRPCGNGTCDDGENGCNCPEDCPGR